MQKLVLLVDDDSRNIFALKAMLKARGYDVVSASSAQEMFDVLGRDHQVGIILLDMMMPDTDGYAALAKLKAEPVGQKIPVIAVTAQAMKGDREKCLAAGADDYLAKPVDVDKLLELLKVYLQ